MTKERAEEECTTMGEAYIEGYQQGRADKYQEIVSEYMLFTEEQVKQIKANAIDEFVSLCKKTETHLITNWGKPFGIDFEGIDEISEQLKGVEE